MPYHPFFDALQYPWPREDARAFHRALHTVVDRVQEINLLYQQAGATKPLTPQLAPDLAWAEILNNVTKERCLSTLCTVVLSGAAYVNVHLAAAAIRDAEGIRRIVLPGDIVFLDRKGLRAELETLSQPGASRVLLVRGESGVGKSWTQELIKTIAADRGDSNLYLFEGMVSNVSEVVEQLFAALGDSSRVPTKNETEPAWYRRVCLKLQELALEKNRFLWVVADDLGEYDGAPRLDRDIRAFFNQFALNLANPVFAQWFRLILIDYPEGPVPTKWRAWSEDRPSEQHVDKATIAEFVLKWAEHKQKQLGVDRANELADEILVKVAVPPAPTDPDPRRLPRIHAELNGVLKTL
jgi:hypothetical protein